MAKIKYDVSNVEDSPGFEHVQPGMYIGKVVEINEKESKSGNGPMLEVIIQPVKDTKGAKLKPKDKKKQIARVYTYVLLAHEPSEWKLKEFITAMGLPAKGAIDPVKLVGKEVQVNLKPDTDLDDNYRPRVGKLLALALAKSKAPEPDEDEDEDEDSGDDEEPYTKEDLDGLDDDDLAEVAEELEVDMPPGKLNAAKKKKLITALLEAQEDEEQDEDEEEQDEKDDDEQEEGDGEESYTWSELVDMDLDELREVIEEEELEVKTTRGVGKKKKDLDVDTVRAAVAEALDIEQDEEDSEDDDDDSDDEHEDYTTWGMDDLKKEAKERGLSVKGTKKVLAGRLAKDDESDNPF